MLIKPTSEWICKLIREVPHILLLYRRVLHSRCVFLLYGCIEHRKKTHVIYVHMQDIPMTMAEQENCLITTVTTQPNLPRPQSLAITFWGILTSLLRKAGTKRVIPAHPLCSFPSSPPVLLACLQLSRTCILGKAWGGGSRLIITTAKFPTAEKIRNVNHPQSDMAKDGSRPMELIFLTFKLKSCSIKVKTFVKENIGDRLKIIY